VGKPVVGAIIVSYGPSFRARDTVRSLLEADETPDYLLVVNNGPSRFDTWSGVPSLEARDVTLGMELERGVTVIEASKNLGYSGGLRLGVSALTHAEIGTDYLWLLNNDIIVHRGALDALLAAAAGVSTVGMWGSTMCEDNSFATVSAIGVRYSSWTTRKRPVLAGMRAAKAIGLPSQPLIDYIVGAAMFMPFDAYSRCGGLSTDYFMYYEELDLAARLRALGLALGWCRQSLIAHAGGATTGSYRLRRARPPAVAYHSMRSAVVYTRRHKPSAVPTVIISRVLAHVCLNAVLGDVHAALAAARGCAAGLTARLREGP